MATKAKSAIPEGYHSVTPYLIVKGAAKAIEWYARALGANELYRMDGPGGSIVHAEIQIGDSRVMLADESPEMGATAPGSLGGTPVGLMLYVTDVDAVFARAVKEGAKQERPVADQFYGDRMGSMVDPFGHKWTIGTHVEDVSPEEMEARHREFMAKMGQGKK
ncbi:VOC family protein [Sandaracinus amylolyticus]|nr:VOC family protein [Sandaracinus amylolyticus]